MCIFNRFFKLNIYGILAYFLLSICTIDSAFAQVEETNADYTWWNNLHHWDGIRNWSEYIIKSPGYMGPNALPVPFVRTGRVGGTFSIENTAEIYRGYGEETYNTYHKLYMPLAPDKVAFEIDYRPLEYFKTNDSIRDERFARTKRAEGVAIGDVWLAAIVQVLKEDNWKPDATIDVSLKTTAGKELKNARHTNAPAYIFNTSFGKTLYKSVGILKSVKGYAMLGLYVWQALPDEQNDALVYGIKSDFTFSKVQLSPSVAGYSGWLKNRDKPVVARMNASWLFNKCNFTLSYQYGINDFIENAFRIGCTYYFGNQITNPALQ